MEKLEIKNFAGIKHLEIELGDINVFIGPQASGKSVISRLIYFFRKVPSMLIDFGDIPFSSKPDFQSDLQNEFTKLFKTIISESSFEMKILYSVSNFKISVENTGKIEAKTFPDMSEFRREIIREYSSLLSIKGIVDQNLYWSNGRQKFIEKYSLQQTRFSEPTWIPDGRSFISTFGSFWLSIASRKSVRLNAHLDPLFEEFASLYDIYKTQYINDDLESLKIFDDLSYEILKGKYVRNNETDFIIHKDNRKVKLSIASSGQKETLPMVIYLSQVFNYVKGQIDSLSRYNEGATVFIEEPEASIYPKSQNAIVRYLARMYNESEHSIDFTITTHSPYILTSINNLLEAGSVIAKDSSKAEAVYNVVQKNEVLLPGSVKAFFVDNGTVISIMDDETGLINAEKFDEVSQDLDSEFDALLDLEF